MIQHELQKEIDEFIDANNRAVESLFMLAGHTKPMLNMFCFNPKTKSFDIKPVLVDGRFLDSEQGKEILSKMILPQHIKMVNNSGLRVVAVSWSTEAWLRGIKWDSPNPPTPKEMKELQAQAKIAPKEEVVITTYETETDSYLFVWDVIDNGRSRKLKQRDFKDAKQPMSSGGRFQNLLGKQTILN